jgi:hypothetical protein
VKLVEEMVRMTAAEPPLTNTLVELSVTVRPGELNAVRVTVPMNPFTAMTVTVDVTVAS